MNEKQLIVAIIRREYEQANQHYLLEKTKLAGIEVSAKTWDDEPDNGIGFGRNPYDVKTAALRSQNAGIELAKIKSAYELVVDTFLESPTPDSTQE